MCFPFPENHEGQKSHESPSEIVSCPEVEPPTEVPEGEDDTRNQPSQQRPSFRNTHLLFHPFTPSVNCRSMTSLISINPLIGRPCRDCYVENSLRNRISYHSHSHGFDTMHRLLHLCRVFPSQQRPSLVESSRLKGFEVCAGSDLFGGSCFTHKEP